LVIVFDLQCHKPKVLDFTENMIERDLIIQLE